METIKNAAEAIEQRCPAERKAVEAENRRVRAFHELSAVEAARGGDANSTLPPELSERHAAATAALARAHRRAYDREDAERIHPERVRRFERIVALRHELAREIDDLAEFERAHRALAARCGAPQPVAILTGNDDGLRSYRAVEWELRGRRALGLDREAQQATQPRPVGLAELVKRVLSAV
jgi:hypothetical protein